MPESSSRHARSTEKKMNDVSFLFPLVNYKKEIKRVIFQIAGGAGGEEG